MNYIENLQDRAKMLYSCDDIAYRSAIMEQCKRDILFWFEYWCYTDRNTGFIGPDIGDKIPFIPFDFQKEFILDLWDAIIEGQKPIAERVNPTDVFVEKSRQMGLSWMIVAVFVYGWLFHNHKYLMISQKEDDVDKPGNIKSLFEKARFIISSLPVWMLPPGFSKEMGTTYNKFCAISKPNETSSITGESANPNASRGGTYSAILLDEMATMANASQINTAAGRATPCRIFNSTPHGKGNEYYRIRVQAEKNYKLFHDGKISYSDVSIRWHRLHWSEHPHYTTEWYEKEKRKPDMTPEKIAQELDISYDTSLTGRVYPEFLSEQYPISYNERLPVYISIDNSHGGADPHAIIVCQPDGHFWNIIDYMEINCSVTDMAMFLAKKNKMPLQDYAFQFYTRYLSYKPAIFVADPYDTHSTLNTTTIYEEYSKVGLFLNTGIIKDKKDQIMRTRSNIYRYKISDSCTDLVTVISNARYPETKEGSNSTQAKETPVHDWTSHGRSALEYLTCFLIDQEKNNTEEVKVEVPVKNRLTGEISYRYI